MIGLLNLAATLIAASTITFTVSVSAYAPASWGPGPHYFKNGEQVAVAHNMKVCACGSRFPLGTVFYVEEFGRVTCVDRGGEVGNNNIDVLFYTGNGGKDRRDAIEFGRKKLRATVVRSVGGFGGYLATPEQTDPPN